MNNTSEPVLSRSAIRRIMKRRYGASAETARRAGVGRTAVHLWLKGTSVSANVERHAREMALEILNEGRRQ